MHRISDEQRRIRLGRRHLLAPFLRAASPVSVADAVVALHATDAATVFLSTCARLSEAGVVPVEQALYGDVSLVRQLSMRNTLFVVSRELAPCIDASNARAVAAKERRTFLKHLADDGNGLDERWLADAEQQTLAALSDRGTATGTELSAAVAALRTKITVFPGKKAEGVQGVASRVIRILAAEGRIRRDRPRGSWTSSQFRWTASKPWPYDDPAQARAELTRRWLRSYGPATEADLKWWTGWGLGQARKALAAVGAEEVRLDNGTVGRVLPQDMEPEPAPEPWAALLPGDGPIAGSTCRPGTGRLSSTGPATSARPCGGTVGSWAAGPSEPTVSRSGGCCPTSAGTLPPRSKRKRPGSRNGWVRHGSLRASVPHWNGS